LKILFNQTGTIQAFLFKDSIKSFSEITEQKFIATSKDDTVFILSNPPGNLKPYHSQVIVTKNNARLIPPTTTYYEFNGPLSFDISQTIKFAKGKISVTELEVYVNGQVEPANLKWQLIKTKNQIKFAQNSLKTGDVVAIVVKKAHDYLIDNGSLVVVSPVQVNDEFSVITFTNHDPDFIRTDRFNGRSNNQYRVQRPILHPTYAWVFYNGVPLVSDLDFKVSEDNQSIIVRDGLYRNPNDDIVVTSFADIQNQSIAYRIFQDMLNRTHFKRLSATNSTELESPLNIEDDVIVVKNSAVLTPPNIAVNRPGIVLINGERIEFLQILGNTLRQLRRGTLGTMPKLSYEVGSAVIDQGLEQTIPFKESMEEFETTTARGTREYQITGINFFDGANYWDQIEVVYQGRLLRKPLPDGNLAVKHNGTVAYDSGETDSHGVSSDILLQPEFTVKAGGILVLSFDPTPGARLLVTKRGSHSWYNSSQTLVKNITPQAKFLLERTAVLPDKYLYER